MILKTVTESFNTRYLVHYVFDRFHLLLWSNHNSKFIVRFEILKDINSTNAV